MVRHFIQSGVLAPLEREHEVVYVFPFQHRRFTVDPNGLGLGAVRLLAVSEQRAYRLRRFYQATVLKQARSSPDLIQLYRFWYNALGPRSFLRSLAASLPPIHWIYGHLVAWQNGRNVELNSLLTTERIDVVVHPTVLEGLWVTDLAQWASITGKPLVYLMNSWDNPSVKAMTQGSQGWLVVWGPQSKRDAIRHLGWPESRIRCFGAAQFNVYRQTPAQTRAQFLTTLGFAPEKRTLLYAGSSKGLNEVAHLRDLEKALEQGQLPECQIIFRPHPWRGIVKDEADFFSFAWHHVRMDPQMTDYYRASRTQKVLFRPDYVHTHTLLSSIDALLSPVSTILLEATIHGVPALAYMPEEETRTNWFARTMTEMRFMQEFFERVDCRVCRSQAQLPAACRELLMRVGDRGLAEHLRGQSRHFVSDNARDYGEQLVDLIAELLSSGAPGIMSGTV